MGEADREVGTLNCPRCGGTLQGREEKYAFIYTCDACGVQILDYKFKVGDCIILVLEVLEEMESYVSYLVKKYEASLRNFYLYKSRARGDCEDDSDIDIWMEVPSHVDADYLNSRLVENPLPWYEYNGRRVVWDFKFGVGPPSGTHYDSQTLRKLRAMLLSS